MTNGAPSGTPVYAELYHGNEAAGLAAGVAARCQFGLRPRHFYFPTVPAVVEPSQREAALSALVDRLRAGGAADIQVDSYDASWQPEARGLDMPPGLTMPGARWDAGTQAKAAPPDG